MRDIIPFDRQTKKIVDAVAALIVVLDQSGRVVFFNKACKRLTGYRDEEVVGHDVWEFLISPEEAQSTKVVFSKLVAHERPSRNINCWRDKAGNHYLISWSNTVVRNAATGDTHIIGTGIDITEQTANISMLSEREARLKAIFDSAIDGIIVANSNGVIEQANYSAAKMFGYDMADMKGRDIATLFSTEEPILPRENGNNGAGLTSYFDIGQSNGRHISRESQGKRRDNALFPLHLSITEIFLSGSSSFVAMVHDLTERNKNLEELHQAQKMEAMGQLTGGLAHDFNNLLTVILGDLEMLYNHVGGTEGKLLLDDALENVDLGVQLVDRLLAFGRRQALSPKVVNVNKLLSGMYYVVRRTIGEDIKIIEDFGEKIWPISADPVLIESALLNLILNARDALPTGGTITLQTENFLNGGEDSRLAELPAGEYTRIAVIDNGTGMSPETREHIFEPFFTTKAAGSGTGLGVSMVYGFVRQSGGNIYITSAEGHGTTVDIFLPKVNVAAHEGNEPGPMRYPLNRGRGETILYVEDDARVREMNTHRLRELGYQVFKAADGPAALQVLADKGPMDMLFTDMVMPGGITGKELGDLVRQQQPGIKILLTTGHADQLVSGECIRENILKKPYNKEVLSFYLRQTLDS